MLYLITNRSLIRSENLYSVIQNALMGGVDRVILREKDLSHNELLLMAAILQPIIAPFNVPLIINTDIDVANSLSTEGFHIGFKSLEKKDYSFKGLFGVSVHSLEEAILAEKYGADYLLASHIFETDCKKGLEPKGLKLIKNIKSKVDIPVIGLGGIDHTNADKVIRWGADGIAVMSYIMASKNPYKSARNLKGIITNYQPNPIPKASII